MNIRRAFATLCGIYLLIQPASALEAVMDFDAIPSTTNNTVTSPYIEDGLKLECFRTNNTAINFPVVGVERRLRSGTGAETVRFRFSAASGRPFTLVSIRLESFFGDNTVTFTATLPNASTVAHTVTSGPNGSIVRIFPATFQEITAVEWISTTSSSTYFNADDFTALLHEEIRLPTAVTVTEGSGSVNFGVSFAGPLSNSINLTWQATAGSAAHPADYSFGGSTTGTVTVPAGAREWKIPCSMVSDTTTESLESFNITFSTTSPRAWFPANTSTTVNIGNDDGVANFAGWMSGHGLSSTSALPYVDPNTDGISNIESWLLRINPAGPSPEAWFGRRPALHLDAVGRPALRFTVPNPLPSDVRLIVEESTVLNLPWFELARRTGFGLGSLWTGAGSNRIAEVSNGSISRTFTCPGSQTTQQRPKTFLRMRYELVSGGGSS